MATYVDYDNGILVTITGKSEGVTLQIPNHWSVAQIEKYVKYMQEFVGHKTCSICGKHECGCEL